MRKATPKVKYLKIDGVNFNATHFSKMKKEDAVKEITESFKRGAYGSTDAPGDAKWAAKVYDELVKATQEPDAATEQAAKAESDNKRPALDTQAPKAAPAPAGNKATN